MRHAAIAQALLPPAMSLASVWCALIFPPSFALARAVAQRLTPMAAVALAAVVTDAHGESLVAVKTSDLDEVDLLVPAGHVGGKADLDNARGGWEALSVTRPSFLSLRRLPGRPSRGGRALPPRRA